MSASSKFEVHGFGTSHRIIRCPGKADLIAGVFYGQQMMFTIEGIGVVYVDGIGIEPEDGSGHSWNIVGGLISTDGGEHRFKKVRGYFRTDRTVGNAHLRIMEGN